MNFTTVVAFDEISLKSRNVKRQFVQQLSSNIKQALRSWGLKGTIRNEWDQLFIDSETFTEATSIAQVMTKIFGIASASPAVVDNFTKINSLITTIANFVKSYVFPNDILNTELKIKQNDKFPRSDFLNELHKRLRQEIPGLQIISKDITNQRELYITIQRNTVYLMPYHLEGPGGFPLGTNGKFVSLISSGIDSPVATWLMMKRGAYPIFVHFNTSLVNKTDAKLRNTIQIIKSLTYNWGYGRRKFKLYIIPYGEFIKDLANYGIDSSHTCVFCKRFMLKIAETIAVRENAQALVTGDNLGQVASQTAWNLVAVDESVNQLPVFRPLIGFNKRETIDLGRRIGTFDINLESTGDCKLLPPNPTTKAELSTVKQFEKSLDLKTIIEDLLSKASIDEILPP